MAAKTPKYSGQLTKVTGEGEHITLAFTAGTVPELRAAVGVVGAVAAERVKANNDAVLDAAATFEQRQTQVYSNAVAQLRREFSWLDPDRLTAAPPGDETNSHADDPAGPLHAPTDP